MGHGVSFILAVVYKGILRKILKGQKERKNFFFLIFDRRQHDAEVTALSRLADDLGAGMMHERDLPHEREAEPRAALGAGGVAPVKPLPDLFLLGPGDAGAVVLDGDHGAAVLAKERDADVPVFRAVFVGVLHQVEHCPREEIGRAHV